VEIDPLEGTRGKIIEQLAVAPKTARDLAQSLGIQESAARGHLDRLEGRGLVAPTFRREGVGRPRKRYTLTARGLELFPKQYDRMLDAIVEQLLEKEGAPYVDVLFAKAAERLAHSIERDLPPSASPEEKAQHLVELLNRLGFRSAIERTDDGKFRIVRTNCVFRRSALTHPALVCDVFDKHLTEALLGDARADLQDSIVRGGSRCAHLIQLG
jgi:predicted ArsR family transcriptional regulator